MTRALPTPPDALHERTAREGCATLDAQRERERFSPSEAPRAGDEAERAGALGVLDEVDLRRTRVVPEPA